MAKSIVYSGGGGGSRMRVKSGFLWNFARFIVLKNLTLDRCDRIYYYQ